MESYNPKLNWQEIAVGLNNLQPVEGGFSSAKRGILCLNNGEKVFVKVGTTESTIAAAQKEIQSYSFLQSRNFPHISHVLATNPDRGGFVLPALLPEDGWNWKNEWTEERLAATLQAMDDLAEIPLDDEVRELFSEDLRGQERNGWRALMENNKQEVLLQKLKEIDFNLPINFDELTEETLFYEIKKKPSCITICALIIVPLIRKQVM